MLPLFHEYRIGHHRFREHVRSAYLMSMIAPTCALVYFQVLGWWNPWLWGTCGVGLSIALVLYSVVRLHKAPIRLTKISRELVARSDEWFPYFFVVVQSTIASLIVMFIWFSFTSLAFDVPAYVDTLLVVLALMIPLRRYNASRLSMYAPIKYQVRGELLRGIWHVLFTIFLVRIIIGLTITETSRILPENVVWQVMLWLPALLYILFTVVLTIQHINHLENDNGKRSKKSKTKLTVHDEPMDKI
ncbi:MAG TPA: hypothetical protein PJ991_06490 [Kiritimatiellia bacterium]|nr:hypothetical protein [Kiritimatiellia bacterium]